MSRSLSHPSQHDSDETHRRWCHRPPRHQRGRHHRPLPPDPSAVVALVELVGLDARGGGRPDRAQRLQRREERRRLHRRLDCRGPGHRLGFVVSGDGLVVTNHHVIEGASDVTVKIGTNGKQRAAQIVADDPSHDLALLKVDTGGASLQKLSLGDSSKVDVGDATYAIGNPFGLDHTFTTGVVSALHRDLQAPNGATITGGIQTDAAINPGNSGGPLLDSAGQVIGVNAQIATGSQTGEGANVGIGFAIPSSTVKQFLSDAKAGKDAPQSQQTQPDPTQQQQDPTQQQQQQDPQTDPFGGGQVDPQQMDPSQVDPQQMDPSQVDPQQVDPSQVDPSQIDPQQVDPSGGQTDPFGDQQQAAPQQQADPFGGIAG
jgi:putative serine protease PepD